MKKLLSGALFVMFLLVSSGAFSQRRGTGMLFLPQKDAPASLIETTHSIKDLLVSAKLKNRSKQLINGYRIGWVALYPAGKDKLGLGLPVELPQGIKPGATISVPAQGVSMDYAFQGAIVMVFFVTDVHTVDENGTTGSRIWKPALEKFEEDARSLTTSIPPQQ